MASKKNNYMKKNQAPLKFNNCSPSKKECSCEGNHCVHRPEPGAIEYDGKHIYKTFQLKHTKGKIKKEKCYGVYHLVLKEFGDRLFNTKKKMTKSKLKLWQIKRSDKHERCASCLKVLKIHDNSWIDERFLGQRFRRVGVCCRKLTIIK